MDNDAGPRFRWYEQEDGSAGRLFISPTEHPDFSESSIRNHLLQEECCCVGEYVRVGGPRYVYRAVSMLTRAGWASGIYQAEWASGTGLGTGPVVTHEESRIAGTIETAKFWLEHRAKLLLRSDLGPSTQSFPLQARWAGHRARGIGGIDDAVIVPVGSGEKP